MMYCNIFQTDNDKSPAVILYLIIRCLAIALLLRSAGSWQGHLSPIELSVGGVHILHFHWRLCVRCPDRQIQGLARLCQVRREFKEETLWKAARHRLAGGT